MTGDDLETDFDEAMADVLHLFAPSRSTDGGEQEASLVVLRTTRSLADLLPALRKLADAEAIPLTTEP